MNDMLAAELMTMANQEKRVKAHSMRFGAQIGGHEDLHRKRMKEILGAHGWPSPSLVGESASRDALTLILNSGDTELQNLAFELLKHDTKTDTHPVLQECLNKLTLHLHR